MSHDEGYFLPFSSVLRGYSINSIYGASDTSLVHYSK